MLSWAFRSTTRTGMTWVTHDAIVTARIVALVSSTATWCYAAFMPSNSAPTSISNELSHSQSRSTTIDARVP